MLKDRRVLIIIPAFNEAENIEQTIRDILTCKLTLDILVIDDGSTDDTAHKALQVGAQVVQLPFNLGIGGAVQTGFKYAFDQDYDFALQFDGDGQHDAKYIEHLLTPLLITNGDMTIGSRFLELNDGFKSTFSRRIGINFFVFLINRLTGIIVKDPTSGFRAFNRKAIAFFAFEYPTDFPEPEAIVLAHRAGLLIKEIPVLMRSRSKGYSSIRHLKSLYYMFKVTLAILLLMLRQPRRG